MFQLEYSRKENVLYSEFIGEIDIPELLQYIRAFGENKSLPRDLNVFHDFQHASFMFKPSDTGLIIREMRKYVGVYNTVRVAAVYLSPKDTAYAQLIEQGFTFNNFTHKIFYSVEAAESWLKFKVLA